ncbi:DNA-3-methyladenine glycosylase I [Williamsia sterculiae]|uniref:DNA-3-methyladenine glycosylase I n=1 Tax=Williamsia sterculiae TaxID=1344003 RepID=A0A1N7FGF2_9NOCA|nr:DNA-3-methyladenine glycosylase I [Williamsia sterculiae]SIR99383.1 DNA-3-methyladenine glycosylase I [Williamsia sterculiae]
MADSPTPVDGDTATGAVRCDDGLLRPVWAATPGLMQDYYDSEWGMPVHGDDAHFERLSLEAFQSGLSWATVLRKRPAFREDFADFRIDAVAAFDDADVDRLLDDARIIRNRAKIVATIGNARAAVDLRADGGLAEFIWSFRPVETPRPRTLDEIPTSSPESVALSKALRTRGFRFVGPTTMFALMEAVGLVDTHLLDSHRRGTSGVWT